MTRTASLLLGAAIAMSGASAHAENWQFSTGADYTTGDYGEDQETNILVVPFAASYDAGRWRAGITVPYVQLEGSGNVTAGAGSGFGGLTGGNSNGGGLFGILPGEPTPTPTTIEEGGLGDVTLSFGVTPWQHESGRLSLNADLRLPTGDEEKSLGAGETIASLSTAYAHNLSERASIYGVLGYQYATESEQDATFAGAGVEGFVSERVLLGASAEWAEASIDGRENQAQANLYASFAATDHVRIVAYALSGLTDTSPEAGGGLRLVFKP